MIISVNNYFLLFGWVSIAMSTSCCCCCCWLMIVADWCIGLLHKIILYSITSYYYRLPCLVPELLSTIYPYYQRPTFLCRIIHLIECFLDFGPHYNAMLEILILSQQYLICRTCLSQTWIVLGLWKTSNFLSSLSLRFSFFSLVVLYLFFKLWFSFLILLCMLHFWCH